MSTAETRKSGSGTFGSGTPGSGGAVSGIHDPHSQEEQVCSSISFRLEIFRFLSFAALPVLILLSGAGITYGQIPGEYIGEWKIGEVDRKGKKMFQLRTHLVFCEDSTVLSSTYSRFAEEATRKVGVVREWGEEKIEIEYGEIWHRPDDKDGYEFKTLYTEIEYFFVIEKKRNKMTLSFSRIPELPEKQKFILRKVSSLKSCPEMEDG